MIARTPCRALAAVVLFACAGASGADGRFFAAVGVSTRRDGPAAAEQAVTSALAKCRAAGRKPVAVIFLERIGGVSAEAGKAVGDRIKAVAGVPTYGTGGPTGAAGPTWWAKSDYEPTLQVLALAGDGLTVGACCDGGPLPRDREAVRRAAGALGEQVRAPAALALLLGGVDANSWGPYADALRDAVRPAVPILGAAGAGGDYVYVDGRPVVDAAGRPAAVGRVLLTIAGPIRAALAGAASRNEADGKAVLDEAGQVAEHAAKALGGLPVECVLAFSHDGRMRTSGLGSPGKELAALRGAVGRQTAVFGCFSRSQMGVDNDGRVSIGACRLVLAAVAGAAEPADGPAGERR